jgi:hypothetical protein
VLGGGDARSGRVFDIDERLKQLSAKGDSLERLQAVIDFELFRADLERAVPRANRIKGGRPPFGHLEKPLAFCREMADWGSGDEGIGARGASGIFRQ